jgi:hypothetical protein
MSSNRAQNIYGHIFGEKSKKLLVRCALIPIALTLVDGFWGSSARADGESEPVLTARPGLCILKEQDSSNCEMTVKLIWNTAVKDSFCLYSSVSERSLQCWAAAREGQHHFELSSPQGVEFWLQRPNSNTKLAKITLRIVSLSQRNPQRRRRRHVWSVL